MAKDLITVVDDDFALLSQFNATQAAANAITRGESLWNQVWSKIANAPSDRTTALTRDCIQLSSKWYDFCHQMYLLFTGHTVLKATLVTDLNRVQTAENAVLAQLQTLATFEGPSA